ncbi:MAG: restriction endonuclease [Ktedonobacteraceae bacterium]
MPKSAIPMGSEFGPNQVDLARVLELARQYKGDDEAFTNALATEYKRPAKTAKNTILSMRKYLLIDDNDQLSEVGHSLLALQSQPVELYTAFARHILLNLRGIEVVNAIDTLIKSGERPTQLSIAEILHAQGIYVPPSSTHISKLCGWLRLAGVFSCDGNFECLEMERVTHLIGANQQETDFLAEMPEDQRAILKALCNLPMETIPDREPLQGNKIKEYAEELYGTLFDPKSFKGDVLEPLQTAGYITLVNPSKVTGKSYLVYRTEKFANEYLPVLVNALANTGLAVRQLLRKPLSEILQGLHSENTGIKGKALEALAFYFMRLLGLEFKAWRKRGKKTGGFEVDVIVEGARLIFSRWQIQCKNTPEGKVSLEDIAKEVGLSLNLKSNVILVITTGLFSRDALEYADDIMQDIPLNIITLDKRDLNILTASPLAIVEILNKKARRVMEMKTLPNI